MKNLSLFILFTCLNGMLWGQYTFKGKVIDDTGTPIIGANVWIKNTSNGTITDIDGTFSLQAQDSLAILKITYTGYADQEINAGAQKDLRIQLEGGVELEEAIIVSALGVQKARPKFRLFGRKDKKANAAISRGYYDASYSSMDQESHPIYNTEDYAAIKENRFYEVLKEPLSTFSIDVDAASYSNLRRFLQNGQKPPKDAIRIEEMVNYFDYQYPQPKGNHPFEVITEISDCPWNSEHRLVHIGMQGKKMDSDQLPSSNLVFLIDVSGSMQAANKLPLLQSSLNLLVNQLRSQDRVAIVVYAGAAGLVLPSTKGDNRQKIREAINQLEAGGSTAGAAGIHLAYKIAQEHFVKEGNNRVILATDGDFNVGASSDAALVRIIEEKRKSNIFLTVLGFGIGNYKDNKMQELANKGNGNHAYIDNINEAKKVLVNEFGGTLFTIAKDVKLQVEFNPAKVAGYRLIGYENRLLDAEDFNDDKKDAGELGAGHTVTALYEIIPAGVKSIFLTKVDDLKYQKSTLKKKVVKSSELLTIKLRYKNPKGNKSFLIEKPVLDQQIDLVQTSNNFRFSAAVAEFGLLLRDSEFKQNATYAQALDLAKKAKGIDTNGYRMELIRMIETMQLLDTNEVAKKD